MISKQTKPSFFFKHFLIENIQQVRRKHPTIEKKASITYFSHCRYILFTSLLRPEVTTTHCERLFFLYTQKPGCIRLCYEKFLRTHFGPFWVPTNFWRPNTVPNIPNPRTIPISKWGRGLKVGEGVYHRCISPSADSKHRRPTSDVCEVRA